MQHWRLGLLLGGSIAVSPLALDASLPAFPAMAHSLGVSVQDVGLIVSIFLLGLALGHLIGGPLSDRYGRPAVMYSGLGLFVSGSLAISATDSYAWLLGWRILQSVGAGFCLVSAPAIARDHASGEEGARLFSLIALVTFLVPAIAPLLGTGLLKLAGWPGIFTLMAAYAVAVKLVLRRTLFRSYPVQPDRSKPLHTLVTDYRWVLGHGTAMRLLIILALVFSVNMLFLTHASFVFQEKFRLSPATFSLLMGATVGAMAGFNLLNNRLLRHFGPAAILRAAVGLQALATLYLLAVTQAGATLELFLPGLLLAMGTFGAGMPNIFTLVLDFFRDIAATATALLGALKFSVAGIISGFSSLLVAGDLDAMVLVMAACSGMALLLAWNAPHAVARRHAETETRGNGAETMPGSGGLSGSAPCFRIAARPAAELRHADGWSILRAERGPVPQAARFNTDGGVPPSASGKNSEAPAPDRETGMSSAEEVPAGPPLPAPSGA
ncbi:multidrug effflux MFS transporter [Thiohalorhabdus methylotrophus]|uniref:Multidrug effflux MFS transporter n=1 Tax=Thiohalorhabdus methylotrophus TaxID=3242694 RepID=A0ABV4TU99_9GAMM